MMKLFHMFGFNINSSIERKRSQTQQTDNSFYIHSSRMKNLPIPPMYDQGPQVHQNGRTVNNYLTLLEKIYYTLRNCNLNWFILFSINVLFLTVRCGNGGLMQALMYFSRKFPFSNSAVWALWPLMDSSAPGQLLKLMDNPHCQKNSLI